LLYESDLVMSSRAVFAFIDQISRKEGIENIALLGAEFDGVRNLEPWVKNYLLGATTLKQLLDRYCRLAKHYIPYRHYTLELSEDSARICTTAHSSMKGQDFLRLSDWSNLLLLLRVLGRVLGQSFKPTAMTFQTRAALTPAEREKLQGITVYQGWTTASIMLPRALLATTIPDALRVHPSEALPESMAGPADFAAQMQKLLKPCLSEDWLDVSAAAEMTGCSVRTLQRRLSAAGLSFSELLDQTRMKVAKTLLKQRDSQLIDIGMEVGYSDPAHFSRAFRRVNGVTPSRYRQAISAEASPA
jgi:AraC-like DNA-binding protein